MTDSARHWLDSLTFSMLRFRLRAVTDMLLPPFLGSTLRGAFGAALKRVVCILNGRDCDDCPLSDHCPFVRLFQPRNPLTWLETSRVPPPFVLRPHRRRGPRVGAGSELGFDLGLVGSAIQFLPYFLAAWDKAGTELGLGKARNRGLGRFEIVEVTDLLAPEHRVLYSGSGHTLLGLPTVQSAAWCAKGKGNAAALRVLLKTPVRLQTRGHLIGTRDDRRLTPKRLLEGTYRRLYILAACYTDGALGPLDMPNFPDEPALYSQLRWQDWERFSQRQDRRMRLGGVVGEMVLGPEFRPWFPLLWAATCLHVGKEATFGLGQIECEGLTSLDRR